MLRLDLARLGREGAALVDARIPADDPLWQGTELRFTGPVAVALRATSAGTGELVVRGRVSAELRQECRRCLEPLVVPLEVDVTLVFAPEGSGAEEAGDVRVYAARTPQLDLSEAVREEVILAVDPYVVCDPECRGLCPLCGANRNVESCDCREEASDPRWEVLRSLQSE